MKLSQSRLFNIPYIVWGIIFVLPWLMGFESSKVSALPNIVFILADDLGYGDVSVYNPQSLIPTPNIDQLAEEGIRFIDAHTPASVCTPTRYGFLTGRYAWRGELKRGVIEGDHTPLIEVGRYTIPSLLKQKGYKSAIIGKWHLGMRFQDRNGNPAPIKKRSDRGDQSTKKVDFTKTVLNGPKEHGFDYSFVSPGCPTDDIFNFWVANGKIQGIVKREEDWYIAEAWQHEAVDTIILNRAIEFLEQHQEKYLKHPFFLYLPLSVPHIPWAPPGFVQGKSEAGNRGDQCVLADWIVGQISETLERLKLNENTLFIFSSDNGPNPNDPSSTKGHQATMNWRGSKGMIWEGGHRVPFIARWTGNIKPGSVNNELISLVDLFATFAAISDIDIPVQTAEDSYNILPYFLNQNLDRPIRQDIIHHSGDGVFSIRENNWKLIWETEESGYQTEGPIQGTPEQLYDLQKDPYEQVNLFDKEPERVKSLYALLKKYQDQGYSINVQNN